jgi:ferredoxin-NADP reductase
VLVVHGEPGIGKTALLEYLLRQAVACQVARAAHVQSQMELAFAGLHQLLAPMIDHVAACRRRSGTRRESRSGSAPVRCRMAFCDGRYTTNLPIADVTGGKAWVAFGHDGGPLASGHDGRARLLVTHLYFWKSVKWVRGLNLRQADEPGFWEKYGYHIYGDPWREQRYAGDWQAATVAAVTQETDSVFTIELDPPHWPGHRAGQHLDVRLTAEYGYTAEREYSIASAPGEPVAITVERLEDGEVSPYLTGELRVGDELELRGPVGGYFVWEPGDSGPLMLLAGGSGTVPLRSILRHRLRASSDVPARLLYSSRSWPDVTYRDELGQHGDGVQVTYTLTRGQPAGWTGHTGRIDRALHEQIA